MHSGDPTAEAYLPLGQAKQLVRRGAPGREDLPTGHPVHAEAESMREPTLTLGVPYIPAPHFVQYVSPPAA